MNWFRRLWGTPHLQREKARPRAVRIERRAARDAAELSNIFLFAEGDPVWDAVHELLDDAIVEANNKVVDPAAEVRAIDRAAAEQGALMDFKATLLERVASAREEDALRRQKEAGKETNRE